MVQIVVILLVLLGSSTGAIGTMLVKMGTNRYPLLRLWKSRQAWTGVLLVLFSMGVYLLALHRERLSVVYPLASTTYIFTTLLSARYLGEKMNVFKWIAIIGIIGGVALIGMGS